MLSRTSCLSINISSSFVVFGKHSSSPSDNLWQMELNCVTSHVHVMIINVKKLNHFFNLRVMWRISFYSRIKLCDVVAHSSLPVLCLSFCRDFEVFRSLWKLMEIMWICKYQLETLWYLHCCWNKILDFPSRKINIPLFNKRLLIVLYYLQCTLEKKS